MRTVNRIKARIERGEPWRRRRSADEHGVPRPRAPSSAGPTGSVAAIDAKIGLTWAAAGHAARPGSLVQRRKRLSTLTQVVAQLHVVLGLTSDARRHLAQTAGEVETAIQHLERVWHGSTARDVRQAIQNLSEARQAITATDSALASVADAVQAYLDRVAASVTMPRATSPVPVRPATVSVGDGRPAAVAGTWRGKSAAEHAHDRGSSIGRLPARSKRQPIREVRSLDELDDLFAALSSGGKTIDKPMYAGRLVRCPDGTTIGYRVKSKTTAEPTIDIKTPDGWSLKIHVNTQGWD